MDPHLLKYAERPAPRYTSYPSAPHFGPEVSGALYSEWLRALPPDASLALYVHVPYCRRICWYCGCNTNAAHAGDTIEYIDTIMLEVDRVASALTAHGVNEVHWGGGTPNILSPEEFTRLFHHLDFWFDLNDGFAHSIEIDPRHMTRDLAEAYAAARVNRASIGVQTLARHVQEAIGRVQPFERIAQAVADLREAGIAQISFDLMYGLPEQSLDDLLHTVQLAASLDPDRIALFGYAHVPWFKRRQRVISESSLPGPEARFEQTEAARAALQALGYVAAGLDHFARPSDALARAAEQRSMRRNFQGYVPRMPDAIIGFGPSAISTFPQGYAQNQTGVGAWHRALHTGQSPVVRGHARTAEDTRRAAIIERIMCDFEVDLAPYGGRQAFEPEVNALSQLAADGLVCIEGDKVYIPEAMRSFCRLVAQAFDAYVVRTPTQHSRAV